MKKSLSLPSFSQGYTNALKELLSKNSNPKLNLSRMKKWLEISQCEKGALKVVQVVGTNGKGSTCAMLESILLSNNISCGFFSSPHLSSARERIRINGQMISESEFISAAQFVLPKAKLLHEDEPSFFECVLAMAMHLFKKNTVQVAILECGLGGRLDATTACIPDLIGIANIDLDHQSILGNTLKKIAYEKIGGAQKGQKIFSVNQHEEVKETFKNFCREKNLNLSYVEKFSGQVPLEGDYQKINAGLAISLAKNLGVENLSDEKIFAKTFWPGRLEKFFDDYEIIFDGAHNVSAMEKLFSHLKNNSLQLIFGGLKGHDTEKIIEIILQSETKIKNIFLHESKNIRAQNYFSLEKIFSEKKFPKEKIFIFKNFSQVKKFCEHSHEKILVCGSLYTVGELRAHFLGEPRDEVAPNF